MSPRTEAIIHLTMSVVIMLAMSLVAYLIGGNFLADKFIFPGAHEENFTVPMLSDWEMMYQTLVLHMGLASTAVLLLWTMLSHWGFNSSSSTDVGKRGIWAFFFVIIVALSFALPYTSNVLIDTSVSVTFLLCYGFGGYWGGSIFVTADRFKYTPLLAGFVR